MGQDIKRELAEAVASKDVAALAALAYQLLGKVQHDDERRARQAEKKRLERESRLSATSGMSPNVPRRPATSGDVADTVQGTKEIITRYTHTAREVVAAQGDEKLHATIERAKAAHGDEWTDVEAFLQRRDYAKWQGWLDEMARLTGPASQFTTADLARVCRDDVILDKPLGSAFALRQFLQNARIERVRPPPGAGAGQGHGTGARGYATTLAAIEDM